VAQDRPAHLLPANPGLTSGPAEDQENGRRSREVRRPRCRQAQEGVRSPWAQFCISWPETEIHHRRSRFNFDPRICVFVVKAGREGLPIACLAGAAAVAGNGGREGSGLRSVISSSPSPAVNLRKLRPTPRSHQPQLQLIPATMFFSGMIPERSGPRGGRPGPTSRRAAPEHSSLASTESSRTLPPSPTVRPKIAGLGWGPNARMARLLLIGFLEGRHQAERPYR
jgi:hypothetical protein